MPADATAPPTLIPRPNIETIHVTLDRVQKDHEEEVRQSFQNANRRKNKILFDAGFDAGVRATLETIQAKGIGAVQNSSN